MTAHFVARTAGVRCSCIEFQSLAISRRVARALQKGPGVRQRGFTLIELMIAVAIIGILAAIAVPQFMKTTRKAKGAEVNAVFAELRQRQEEYHLANGVYFSTGTAETDTFPATPGRTAQLVTAPPASWTTLKVRLSNEKLYCGYVVIAGAAGTATGLGTKAGEFGLVNAPATDWYYLLAHCDLDGNASRDSYYFSWSGDTAVKKQNEGY